MEPANIAPEGVQASDTGRQSAGAQYQQQEQIWKIKLL